MTYMITSLPSGLNLLGLTDKEYMVFIYIYIHIKLSLKREWNVAICNNLDEPRGYCAKWTKSVRERQILCDFTYMWNLRKKMNKHNKNRNRLIDTENNLSVVAGRRLERWAK